MCIYYIYFLWSTLWYTLPRCRLSVPGCHVQTLVVFSLHPPDVYSFQEEGPVLDPHLAKHLAHFGIDMLHANRVRTFLSLILRCVCDGWVEGMVSGLFNIEFY